MSHLIPIRVRRNTTVSFTLIVLVLVLLVTIMASFHLTTDLRIIRSAKVEEKQVENEQEENEPNRNNLVQDAKYNCVIHIHGLHHSGTGFTRQVVYDSLGGDHFVSKHNGTFAREGEGQFLQTVYPTLEYRRQDNLCGNATNSATARCYYCPQLLTLANNPSNKVQLHQEWSKYWNTTKPFLLQKTPTLDVLFLDRMKLHPTMHVLVMRHPFSWKETFLPTVWLNVWTHVLEQLANGMIESFAIVQYETLVQNREIAAAELSKLIQGECNIELPTSARHDDSVLSSPDVTRRLEFHNNIDNEMQYIAAPTIVQRYKKCLAHTQCKALMDDAEPLIQELGYSWNPEISLCQPKKNDDSMLLYTSHHLPTKELVKRMKKVVSKGYPEIPIRV